MTAQTVRTGRQPGDGSECYLDAVARHARDRPTAVALVDADGEHDYARLWGEAMGMAGHLRERGVGPADVVAIWMPNCRSWTVSFLAASMLGAATLAVNISFNTHEVGGLLERSGARTLVVAARHRDKDLVARLRGLGDAASGLARVLVLGAEDEERRALAEDLGCPVTDVEQALRSDALTQDGADGRGWNSWSARPAIVFTSSGTTGRPKMVVHTQHGLSGHVRAVADAYRMTEPDAVVMAPMPFCGVMGMDTMLSGLVAGALVATLPSFDAAGAVEQIRRHRVTTTACSDEALRRLLAQAEPGMLDSLNDVALAVFGGDAAALVRQAREAGFRAFQTYGSSEVHALLCYPPEGTADADLALGGGHPIRADYLVRATDEHGALNHSERGSLEISTPFMLAGYLDAGALVRPLTADGWFRSGDMGYTRPDGPFVYLSRESDALRLGGFLVEPREIEAFLEEQDGVDAAQVVGVEGPGRTTTVAFVLGDDRIDEAVLVERCAASLATFKVPAQVVRLEEFPTTAGPNGVKIRRVDLRDQAEALLAGRAT